jgi:hypothetical protein
VDKFIKFITAREGVLNLHCVLALRVALQKLLKSVSLSGNYNLIEWTFEWIYGTDPLLIYLESGKNIFINNISNHIYINNSNNDKGIELFLRYA